MVASLRNAHLAGSHLVSGARGPSDPAALRPGPIELLIVLGALGLRLLWAALAPDELWFDHVFNDATAWNIATGNGFSASAEAPFVPAIFRTPGYSAFLGAAYAAAGHVVRAGFVANAILDALTCLLAWRLAAGDLGRPAARWVLVLAATYPFTAHATGTLSPESLLVFLALLFVAVHRAWPATGWSWGIPLAGAVLGALAWVKPVFLPLPAFLFLAEGVRRGDWLSAARRAAVVGVVGAALFAPWIFRNQSAFGRPLLGGETGLVLWHGTRDFHPELEKEIRSNFDVQATDGASRYETTRRGLADSAALLARDDEYRRSAMEAIGERPMHAFLLDPLRRVPRLWISTRHVQMPAWVGGAAIAASIGYLALALAGLWVLRGRWRALAHWWVVPVTLTLAYAAIHVEARYTLPARPTLWLLGGAAIHAALLRFRRRAEPARTT